MIRERLWAFGKPLLHLPVFLGGLPDSATGCYE